MQQSSTGVVLHIYQTSVFSLFRQRTPNLNHSTTSKHKIINEVFHVKTWIHRQDLYSKIANNVEAPQTKKKVTRCDISCRSNTMPEIQMGKVWTQTLYHTTVAFTGNLVWTKNHKTCQFSISDWQSRSLNHSFWPHCWCKYRNHLHRLLTSPAEKTRWPLLTSYTLYIVTLTVDLLLRHSLHSDSIQLTDNLMSWWRRLCILLLPVLALEFSSENPELQACFCSNRNISQPWSHNQEVRWKAGVQDSQK